MVGNTVPSGATSVPAIQTVRATPARRRRYNVGSYTIHPEHQHFHYDDWGRFELWTKERVRRLAGRRPPGGHAARPRRHEDDELHPRRGVHHHDVRHALAARLPRHGLRRAPRARSSRPVGRLGRHLRLLPPGAVDRPRQPAAGRRRLRPAVDRRPRQQGLREPRARPTPRARASDANEAITPLPRRRRADRRRRPADRHGLRSTASTRAPRRSNVTVRSSAATTSAASRASASRTTARRGRPTDLRRRGLDADERRLGPRRHPLRRHDAARRAHRLRPVPRQQRQVVGDRDRHDRADGTGTAPPPPAATPRTRRGVLSDGPISYWRLGETLGQHRQRPDAAATTAPTSTASSPGAASLLASDATNKAGAFDGATTASTSPSDARPATSRGSFSLEAWIRPTSLPAAGKFRSIVTKPEAYSLQFNGPQLEFTVIQGGVAQARPGAGRARSRPARPTTSWARTTAATSALRRRRRGRHARPDRLGGRHARRPQHRRPGGGSEVFRGTIDEVAVYTSSSPACRPSSTTTAAWRRWSASRRRRA